MKESEEKELLMMVAEIYHHLGLSVEKHFPVHSFRDVAEKDILNWHTKRLKVKHERSKNQ